jgi:hypothetical protein
MNASPKRSGRLFVFLLSTLLCSHPAHAQETTNVYWNFSSFGTPALGMIAGLTTAFSCGNAGSLSFNATSASSGYVTAAGFAASGGNSAYLTARTGTFNAAISTYYLLSLTLSSAAGTPCKVTDISFGSRQTGTGPTKLALYESSDGHNFSADGSVLNVNTSSTWAAEDFSGIAISLPDDGSTVYFRIYGSDGLGSAGSGNWRIDDLAVTVVTVPEPSTLALATLASLPGLITLWRRRIRPSPHEIAHRTTLV